MQSDWNPDAIKKALDTELSVEGIHAHKQITARKIREAAPVCADAVIHLALWSTHEPTRLRAATYILDRAYGKVTDQGIKVADDEGSLEQHVSELYETADLN